MLSSAIKYIKSRCKERAVLVKLAAVFVVLLASLFGSDIYVSTVNTTGFYSGLNFSNPITQGSAADIWLRPSMGRLQAIEVPLIFEGDTAGAVRVVLYDEAGSAVGEWRCDAQQIEQDGYRLYLEGMRGVKAGGLYRLEISSEETAAHNAYRLLVVEYAEADFVRWEWGGNSEEYAVHINLYFPRLRRTALVLSLLALVGGTGLALLPKLRSKKLRLAYQALAMVGLAVALLWVVESLYGNSLTAVATPALLLTLGLFVALYLLVYALGNRFSVSLLVVTSLVLLVGVINHFTFYLRGTVLLPADIFAAGTALDVVAGYPLGFGYETYKALLVWLAALLLALQDRYTLGSWRPRVASAALATAYTASLAAVIFNSGLRTRMDIWTSGFGGNTPVYHNGLYMNFLAEVPSLFVQAPAGYDAAQLGLPQAQTDALPETAPHIVLILNESLYDASVVGDPDTNRDILPYLHAAADDPAFYTGLFGVSTYGGNTSVTEFEVLAGQSLALEYSVTTPYYHYVRGEIPCLPAYLSGLGYATYATHPMIATNWNRNTAYERMGFQISDFRDDYDDAAYPRLRDFVSDESVYKRLIYRYEGRQEGQAQFMFAVTMQNHGGYDDVDFEGEIQLRQRAGADPYLEQYYSLLYESDRAFESLIEYFAAEDEPVLVVMFGDHASYIGEEYLSTIRSDSSVVPQQLQLYTTPVVMWSNYGADFSGMPEHFSANYLASLIKQQAGLPLTPFDEFSLELMAQYPVVSKAGIMDASGRVYSAQDYAALSDTLVLYVHLEYNALFDVKNRREEFYFWQG